MVHIARSHRLAALRYLFDKGVCVVKKDPAQKIHEDVQGTDGTPIPNLHMMMMMRSLESKGVVRTTFAWRHYYYLVTEEGFAHLRAELGLPESTVSEIQKQKTKRQPSFGSRRPTRRVRRE